MRIPLLAAALGLATTTAFAQTAMTPMIEAADQSVSDGIVSAEMIAAAENGWLVVHRTDSEMTPGHVVGHAPLRKGENIDVAAILTEEVAPGEMLMLMVHSEDGGMQTGIFEYSLGAKEDGPIRIDGSLVTQLVTAQ